MLCQLHWRSRRRRKEDKAQRGFRGGGRVCMNTRYLFHQLLKCTLYSLLGLGAGFYEQHVVFAGKLQTFFFWHIALLLHKHNTLWQPSLLFAYSTNIWMCPPHPPPPPPPPTWGAGGRGGGGELCISAFIFRFKKILLHDEYICALLLISDFNLKTVIVIDIFKLVWHL